MVGPPTSPAARTFDTSVLERVRRVAEDAGQFAYNANLTLKRKEQICLNHGRTRDVMDGLRVEYERVCTALSALEPSELEGLPSGVDDILNSLEGVAQAAEAWTAADSWHAALEAIDLFRASAERLTEALRLAQQGTVARWRRQSPVTPKEGEPLKAPKERSAGPQGGAHSSLSETPTTSSASAAQLFPQGTDDIPERLVKFIQHLVTKRKKGRSDRAIAREFTGEKQGDDKQARSRLESYRRLRREGRVSI